ncbi:MAG: nuclear transport factor 2 family protein [Chloroflexota bacterium]|nr:nuclear transport factor 2 family protein [Chloroflexota bacterium]
MSEQELNDTIEAFREALRVYVKGDGEPALSFFSTREDVTLANPIGPPVRGPAAVRTRTIEGADYFKDGGQVRFAEVSSRFEEVSRFAVSELGYVVQLERHEGRLVSGAETVIALRVTLIFRREEGRWRIVHRHADPITTARPITTTMQS